MPRSALKENLQHSIEELSERIHVLKETVITQSNIIEISELKGKIDVLKEIVEHQQNTMEISKVQIKDLKELVINQNKIIVGLVSEVKVMLKCFVTPGHVSTKYSDLFPIRSAGELKEIENEINDETKYAMVATLKNILSQGGLNKCLTSIFDIKLLLNYNVDGKQGKNRLLDFPKFVNAIYEALKVDDTLSKKKFINDLRTAFRLNKNRCYKKKSLRKHSKSNNSFLKSDSDEGSDTENFPDREEQTPMNTSLA